MCGICGTWSSETQHAVEVATLRRMSDTIKHRGPDDEGYWADPETGIGLGHRRLSIIDLSSAGHQPMHSADRRFVTVFNGEIYNFPALRRELEALGHQFSGHSDTEVMLAAFSRWGVEAGLKRLVGMFAFALFDRAERVLYLARDRMGEKPLYYGWSGKSFLFGSSLRALEQHPDWRGEIDRGALALLLRHNYIPAPWTIWRGIRKLPPGTLLRLPQSAARPGYYPEPLAYWSAREAAENGSAATFTGSDSEAISEFDRLLREVIAGQMISDVPLGAFLSGGVDSSTVVALMQAQSAQPVRTFTIGFHETRYNEAEYAKAVAQHLGTDHTELYVTPEEAMAVIPRLPEIYDEPFADSSQIPTFLVSQLARQKVTVSLSGDGGDELFCGYNRYEGATNAWNRIGWMPAPVRQAGAPLLKIISSLSGNGIGAKFGEMARNMAAAYPELIYHRLVSQWTDPLALVSGAEEPLTALTDRKQWAHLPDFTQSMMYLDLVTYLPDDILVKVDRASMGVSLESRVPLLDHRVVEFAWRLPHTMKVRNGQRKWILRQVLYRYVPQELIERPKTGFGIPINEWLRGPLRDWAEALLDERRLSQGALLSPQPIRERWQQHLAGQQDWSYSLWTVLMFQAWLSTTTAAECR